MFAAKNHETSKTKAEKPLAQANAKGEKSERVQANPLWNQLATWVQAKLIVGISEDPCEREADRVADKVMAASPNPAVRGTPPRIQRFAEKAIGETGMAPASVDRALANSGRPLEPALRQDMEQRFGHDFSRVRLHSGASGEQSARDVNAHAYTVGHDIVFGAGRFAPETHEGRRLLAHELAHVVQQSGADGNRLGQNNESCGGSAISQPLAEGGAVARKVQRQPAPPAEIEMPAEYIGTVDKPADVLDAIVNIMSATDYFGDISGLASVHPLYYIRETKSVTKKEYVDLLWWWFQITNEKVTDKHGIQTIVEGSMARTHITQAVAETAPIVKAVEAAGGVNARLVTRYKAKIEEFTRRAAREEVTEMLEAGVEKERMTRAKPGATTEEEMAKAGAVKAAATLDQLAAVARRLTAKFGTSQLKETFDQQMQAWVKEFTRETSPFIPEPVAPAMKMNFADGITWLKGGLDAATAILIVTDPAARQKLFEARAGYFGKMAQGMEINRLLWQFVSGTIAISGASVYGIARVLGNTKLAADVLEVSTKWIGNVAGPLFLVGVFHGAAVLLDPEASANEKAEAAVEVASSAVGVVGFASRWMPRLAGAARWSGPIAASLTINFYQFKYLADLAAGARIGLSRLDWVPCFQATNAAAEEVQQWAVRLAVINALMAQEADVPRLRELRNSADACREELVERQIKPYVESKTRLGSTNQDPDDCGPALTDRFKPLLPLLAPGVKTDDAALQVAATFLNIVSTAFTEWDKIVMAKSR